MKTLMDQMVQAGSTQAEAVEIIETLRLKAAEIVRSVLNGKELSNFVTTGMGNFPYMYENPRNLEFNLKTYNWINANLKAGMDPLEQDSGSTFTDLFARAIGSIDFSLSKADQAALNEASKNATLQQAALLKIWKQQFGTLPKEKPGLTIIDQIVDTILTKWASKKDTDLTDVQKSKDLNALLDKTPASGQPVLPVLSNWVNALGAAVSLQNASSRNRGFLNSAKSAVDNPSEDNGALIIDGEAFPAYKMATPLNRIINALSDDSQKISIKMSVSRYSSSEFQVKVEGQAGFRIPVLGLFSVNVGGQAKYFQEEVAIKSNTVEIELTYTGVTAAQYEPVAYNGSTGKDWFFMKPIREAIANGDADVTGYKFGPDANIDFSEDGPFGIMNTVVFANYPSARITVTGANYQSIAKTFEQSASVGLTFLGIPLGIGGSEATYSRKVNINQSSESVTITMDPPSELVAGELVDSEGWVLGVVPEYPAA